MRIAILIVLATLALAACSQPPATIEAAQIGDNVEETHAMEQKAMDDAKEQAMEEKSTEPEETEAGSVMEEGSMIVGVDNVALVGSFQFEGYGPGKSHVGTFESFEAVAQVKDGDIIGGYINVQSSSVKTDSGGLDKHLKTDDFFDVEVYPEIRFEAMDIADGTMSGQLSFHGVTEKISFPVTVSEEGISADFLLDTTAFNIKYIGINKDVRIFFNLKI